MKLPPIPKPPDDSTLLRRELELAAARLDFVTNWLDQKGGHARDVANGRSYAKATREAAKEPEMKPHVHVPREGPALFLRGFYDRVGGRKQFNGYLGTLLICAYALWTRPEFLAFCGALVGCLGLTQFSVAYEDKRKEPEV